MSKEKKKAVNLERKITSQEFKSFQECLNYYLHLSREYRDWPYIFSFLYLFVNSRKLYIFLYHLIHILVFFMKGNVNSWCINASILFFKKIFKNINKNVAKISLRPLCKTRFSITVCNTKSNLAVGGLAYISHDGLKSGVEAKISSETVTVVHQQISNR